MNQLLYQELIPVRIDRVDSVYSNEVMARLEGKLAYDVLGDAVSNSFHVGDIFRAYEKGGLSQVLMIIEDALISRLRSIYEDANVEFDGEICFSKLVDLGLIDEDTAVYLIATYMSIEEAVEEIEELEELGEEVKVRETLKEVSSKLLELVQILDQLKASAPKYGSGYSYYVTEYMFTGNTYVSPSRGST